MCARNSKTKDETATEISKKKIARVVSTRVRKARARLKQRIRKRLNGS